MKIPLDIQEGLKNGIAEVLSSVYIVSGGINYNPSIYNALNNNTLYKTDSVRGWEDKEYNHTIGDFIIETAIINRDTLKTNTVSWETLTNKAFEKYTHLPWDGGDEGHERWIRNGVQPAVEYVRELPAFGMAIGAREKMTDLTLRGYTTNSSGICSPRDVGKLLSKAANVKYLVETYLNSKEYAKLDAFLRSKGYELQYNISEYATGLLPLRAVAGVGPLSSENAESSPRRFHLSTSVAQALADEARYYCISAINSLLNTIEHEFVHLYGIRDEGTLEKLLVEFYDMVINGIPDSNSTYAYERHDIAKRTRENYEQRKRISKHREGIVEQLYGRMKSMEMVSIDELVESLEKEGFLDTEIKGAVRLYEKSNSLGRESDIKENYDYTDEGYNNRISPDETSEERDNSNDSSDDSSQDNDGSNDASDSGSE